MKRMATTEDFLRSAVNGCSQLASLLESFEEGEACPKCGHDRQLTNDAAQKLDTKIWEALQFAETLR